MQIHIPSSLRVANHVPQSVPHTEANCEQCNYFEYFYFANTIFFSSKYYTQ